MFLITYRCEGATGETWGYTMEKDVAEWIESTQNYVDEVYYLVNVLEVTDEFVKKHDGYLRGT